MLLLNFAHYDNVRINLFLLPIFPQSSLSIVVFFFPVRFSSLTQHSEHPTRPVENVVLMTKGLQERKTQLLNGMTVEK